LFIYLVFCAGRGTGHRSCSTMSYQVCRTAQPPTVAFSQTFSCWRAINISPSRTPTVSRPGRDGASPVSTHAPCRWRTGPAPHRAHLPPAGQHVNTCRFVQRRCAYGTCVCLLPHFHRHWHGWRTSTPWTNTTPRAVVARRVWTADARTGVPPNASRLHRAPALPPAPRRQPGSTCLLRNPYCIFWTPDHIFWADGCRTSNT